VVLGIGEIPCIGWIAPFAVALLAFGGVILSRFGRMTYRFQSTSTAVVEAPEPVEEKPKRRTRKAKDEE
ncbi:MAG: hypothetical protein KAH97_09115, partial [Anaerolineales bacterium]|nr:hypothetical protein [Anaerolineales bacterium]